MYGYYPNYSQQYQQTQDTDSRIWVQNETSAEAYLVAPNGFVRLWDANKPVFYEKRADASGRPYLMDVYEYTRKKPNNERIEADIDKSALEDINAQIEAINARLEALETPKKGAKNVNKSDTNDTAV